MRKKEEERRKKKEKKKTREGGERRKKKYRQPNSLIVPTYLFRKRTPTCFQKHLIVSMSGVQGIILNIKIIRV